MHPSKMTNKELQRAIAEVLGWTHIDKYSIGKSPDGRGFLVIPDYPGDIAAAMGLLDGKIYYLWSNTISDDSEEMMFGTTIFTGSNGGFTATSKVSLSRTISEAAYAALTARRNDG